MEKNKTAVEWLIEEQRKALTEYSVGNLSFAGYVNLMADKEKKAKEMEKEQIATSFTKGQLDIIDEFYDGFKAVIGVNKKEFMKNFPIEDVSDGEQYYNETYGGKQ